MLTVTIRLPQELIDSLEQQAALNTRSLSQEIHHRLRQSIEPDADQVFDEMKEVRIGFDAARDAIGTLKDLPLLTLNAFCRGVVTRKPDEPECAVVGQRGMKGYAVCDKNGTVGMGVNADIAWRRYKARVEHLKELMGGKPFSADWAAAKPEYWKDEL